MNKAGVLETIRETRNNWYEKTKQFDRYNQPWLLVTWNFFFSDFCNAGLEVVGFDIVEEKVRKRKIAISVTTPGTYRSFIKSRALTPTADFNRFREVDNIIITVPTPLNEHREPDLSFVEYTAEVIAQNLQKAN